MGRYVRVRGTVRRLGRRVEMAHPAVQPMEASADSLPIYPAIRGISAAALRRIISDTLAAFDLSSLVPECRFRGSDNTLAQSFRAVHSAPCEGEESLLPSSTQRGVVCALKSCWHIKLRCVIVITTACLLPRRCPLRQAGMLLLTESLPFRLTGAQQQALQDIYGHLQKKHAMRCLLQGDVGSG